MAKKTLDAPLEDGVQGVEVRAAEAETVALLGQ
jgi:hypothetical protein